MTWRPYVRSPVRVALRRDLRRIFGSGRGVLRFAALRIDEPQRVALGKAIVDARLQQAGLRPCITIDATLLHHGGAIRTRLPIGLALGRVVVGQRAVCAELAQRVGEVTPSLVTENRQVLVPEFAPDTLRFGSARWGGIVDGAGVGYADRNGRGDRPRQYAIQAA